MQGADSRNSVTHCHAPTAGSETSQGAGNAILPQAKRVMQRSRVAWRGAPDSIAQASEPEPNATNNDAPSPRDDPASRPHPHNMRGTQHDLKANKMHTIFPRCDCPGFSGIPH